MQEGAANGTGTARRANGDGVALSVHAHSEGDRRALPHSGSLRSGLDSSRPKPRRSPSGRLRTETRGTAAGTATLGTAQQNGAEQTAELATAGERRGRSAWELRELIRPLAIRRIAHRQRRRGNGERGCVFDAALVEWIYDSRLAIVSQLQRRFPEWLPSLRTAQRHAARLVQAGYLAPTTVRSTGPHFPMVLHATGRGVGLVREAYARIGRDWEGPVTEDGKAHGIALDSVLHEVLCSEVDLAIHQAVAARTDLMLLNRERRYFRRDRQLAYWQAGERRAVIPDAGYLTAVHTGAGQKLLPVMFLELENGTHSLAKLREKLDRYQEWAEQGAEEYLERLYSWHGESEKRSFRLLFVAHDKHGTVSDQRRLLDIAVAGLNRPRTLQDSIWLVAADDLRRQATASNPLEKPIWYRLRDIARHLQRSGINVASRGQSDRRLRTNVAKCLPELRRHPLFPRPDGRRNVVS